jgi:hypothetical protein
MNLTNIVSQVSRDIDDDYDLNDIKDWVNRALDDLTPISKRQTSATLNDTLTLPEDLHELLFVSQNNQFLNNLSMSDLYSCGYKKWGDSLTIQNGDTSTVTIYYYRKLNHVEAGDDVPDLESEFHDILIFFCLGNGQFYDEDYTDRPDSFNRYEARKQEYSRFIEKRDRKSRVTEKVIW